VKVRTVAQMEIRPGIQKNKVSEEDHFVIYFFPDSGIDKLGSS